MVAVAEGLKILLTKVGDILLPKGDFPIGGDFVEGSDVAPQPNGKNGVEPLIDVKDTKEE